MSWNLFLRKFDWVLLVLALAIMILAMLTFYQAEAKWGHIVEKQFYFILIGIGLTLAVSLFDYRIFKNYSIASIIPYVISIVLLLVTFISLPVHGSKSWIFLAGTGFQPSEFAKLVLLILLAKYFSQKHVEIYRAHHILASGVYAGVPAILTLFQPDFGSMMIFVALWLGMLFFAGIKRKHLLAILMIGVVAMSFAWFLVFKPYQRDRIISFANPYIDPRGIGYNTIQAQTTFGSGQVSGVFFNRGDQKISVLVPEPYTDFAFATYGQKFGLIGVFLLISLIIALIFRIGSIVLKTNNNFSKLFGLGLITIITVHVFMNAGMNLGILPITGIPFSFLSYGGSHLITLMIGLGLVESIKLRG